ncbi:MAG TPA: MATE family efflux transporter [Solirubrobacteraceae bacterium]|nr:MATE family efflux transporter [Solirubrobacteraceae bacterium]
MTRTGLRIAGSRACAWRGPSDRELFRLALPALGALAAEPLYILVDTAIVGHLGTSPLAGLALAGALLTAGVTLFNFLTYGTTAQVARYHGAGEEQIAGRFAAQSLWVSSFIGVVLLVLALTLGRQAIALLGGHGDTAEQARTYLRIGALGLPFVLVTLAGQGYLRGVGDFRTPLLIVVGSNVLNVVLELVFVYGLHAGIAGSAWGTAIAQLGMGGAFVVLLARAPADRRMPSLGAMRPLLRVGGQIFVRTASLYAAFLLASAVIARIGEASLAAHQVVFQLWAFLALVLDAIAIAGQVIVGRALGAGDAQGAYASARRMIGWSAAIGTGLGAVMLALIGVLPHAFTDDPAVLDRVRAIWVLFALMQPANGVVFALDGILIGAGDTRYLMWSMVFASLVVFVPLALLASSAGWGIVGVWGALVGLIVARGATLGVRFRGRAWAVTGAVGL